MLRTTFADLLNAVEKDDIQIADNIIKQNIMQHTSQDNYLLRTDDAGNSILMRKNLSENMLRYLLSAAKKQQLLKKILEITNNNGESIYQFYFPAQLPLLKILFSDENAIDDVTATLPYCHSLNHVRRASFDAKTKQEFLQLDEICSLMKKLPGVPGNYSMKTKFGSQSYTESYQSLFGDPIPAKEPNKLLTREQTLKHVIASIYTLFASPINCLPYLNFLNMELKRYYQETEEKPFPVMDRRQVQPRMVADVLFPIPTVQKKEDFIGLGHKKNILEQFLIQLFRSHDLAEKAVEWIGYVPHHIADEMIKNGDFVQENKYGVGLLHGRRSHMIQQAVIIYYLQKSIQDKTIDLTYQDEHENIGILSFKEIFASFVEIDDKLYSHVWMAVRDRRQLDITFNDPHEFAAFLMRDKSLHTWFNASRYDWQALSDCLTDSFCKNYLDFLEAFNTMHDVNFNADPIIFADYLNDLILRFFELNNFTHYAIEKAKSKPFIAGDIFEKDYAVVTKPYKIKNPDFVPQAFPCHIKQSIGDFSVFAQKENLKNIVQEGSKFNLQPN